ncbi:hypothetical protein [Nocardioides sp. Leaf285]|uniref:hypothetical protein n=1 Tax=Nocardioides sp. Leaf285 TaxID=1736322 RepID=UPI000702F0E5|nr:hypothetical protein [Nocardioides sp. Leaf285]KQP62874.1 hypothetical protein ASF47_17835 [Nocardioides sp. Leaf285]
MTDQPVWATEPRHVARREAARQSNGEFGVQPRSEASVDLFGSAHPVAGAASTLPQGSYLFPPIFRDVEQIVAFAEQVEVPDDVLSRIREAYVETFDEAIETVHEIWDRVPRERWEAVYPAPADPSGPARAAWEQQRAEARRAFISHMQDRLRQRPTVMHRLDTRAVAKATFIVRAAHYLSGDPALSGSESARTMLVAQEHLVETEEGVRSCWDVYVENGVRCYGHEVTNPDNYSERARAERQAALIRGDLADLHDRLDQRIKAAQDDVNDTVIQTGQVVIASG